MPACRDQENEIIRALRRISRAIDLHSRELFQQCGLTAPQLATLLTIGKLQPVSVGRLASAIHLSQATVTGILVRLERSGLAARSRHQGDRRSVVVELTPRGGEVLQSGPSLLHEQFRQSLAALEEWERTQMLAVLQRIAHMMDVEKIEAAALEVPSRSEERAPPHADTRPTEARGQRTTAVESDPTKVASAPSGST
jgi:DNA-binding MarR family transcriptional regulator